MKLDTNISGDLANQASFISDSLFKKVQIYYSIFFNAQNWYLTIIKL